MTLNEILQFWLSRVEKFCHNYSTNEMNSRKKVHIHWLKNDDRRRELILWSVHRKTAKYLYGNSALVVHRFWGRSTFFCDFMSVINLQIYRLLECVQCRR